MIDNKYDDTLYCEKIDCSKCKYLKICNRVCGDDDGYCCDTDVVNNNLFIKISAEYKKKVLRKLREILK